MIKAEWEAMRKSIEAKGLVGEMVHFAWHWNWGTKVQRHKNAFGLLEWVDERGITFKGRRYSYKVVESIWYDSKKDVKKHGRSNV